MRSFLGFLVTSMCIAICTLSENRSMASDSAPRDNLVGPEKLAALNKLKQEKLKTAEERYDAVNVGFQAGVLQIFEVYAASRDWKEAAYESAKTRKDRKSALEKHYDRMAELYKHTHALAGANAKGGEAEKDSSAHFWELEAKIWQLEEETKP
jgi:phosphopantothenoylcysteine synthetase/decarboxylase